MKYTVIIVAGGSGTRMKSEIPKQFIELNGMPILMHTIRKFHDLIINISIRLVLPQNQLERWSELCAQHKFEKEHTIFVGGDTRFQSVKNGLVDIDDNEIVAVHDGVRPLVSAETILACIAEAEKYGAVIPVTDVFETLREIKENKSETVDRTKYKLVQTPQVFHSEIIKNAYEQSFSAYFTDDASVVESYGHRVVMVNGNKENIKITTPVDLKIAEAIIQD